MIQHLCLCGFLRFWFLPFFKFFFNKIEHAFNNFIFQQYTSCKISILPLLTHLHVSHLGKSPFSLPQLSGADHKLWNKSQRIFRDFWVKVYSHKTVGNKGGGVVGRGQLGGPGNCRLPLSPIINSS